MGDGSSVSADGLLSSEESSFFLLATARRGKLRDGGAGTLAAGFFLVRPSLDVCPPLMPPLIPLRLREAPRSDGGISFFWKMSKNAIAGA